MRTPEWSQRETVGMVDTGGEVSARSPVVEMPLTVRLFGEFSVHVGAERAPWVESARGRSLLAHVMLHPGPQSRERLAFLLWPDSSEPQARTNLRHLVHTLRRSAAVVGRHLDVTPQTLWWRPTAACWIDVVAFDDALTRANSAGTAAGDVLRLRREAIEIYTGQLLDGSYDEWVLEERARLSERYVSALEDVAVALAAIGDHAEANRVGRELLRCEPLREDAYRLLMRVSAAAGDRAGAVRVFHECVSVLQRELRLDPSPETNETIAAIMSAEQAEPEERETARVAGSALVGRDAEFAHLVDCWRGAGDGRSRLVLITGEPGIGKTRLVEEFAAWCTQLGALVSQARSYATEGELGYGAAISWLRTAGVSAQLRHGSRSDVAVLSRLLPELAEGPVVAASSDASTDAEQRQRIFDSIARVLTAEGRPILLISDDAQWCDEQSSQLLHYLLRQDRGSPLLVVATARREDLGETHSLRGLINGLQAIDRIDEITIDRLTRGATEQLVEELAGYRVDAAAIDDLYANTEGNPLFIVETVRAGWASADSDRPQLTPKLHAVISLRLGQLSEPARELVALAATVGREASAAVLAGASSLDETSLVRSLDELWRRGILREQGIDAYDFTHGKIRDVAYESLSTATRRRNHRLIAEALREIHGHDLDAVSGELARHYELAVEPTHAVTWYRRAALQAQRMYANVDAIRLLDRAHDLLVLVADATARHQRELEILSTLSTPLAVVEGFASPRLAETQRRAVELAGMLGLETEASLLRSTAMTNLCRNDFTGAVAVAGRLADSARDAGDDVLTVESQYLLGIGAFWGGAMDQARTHFEHVASTFDAARRAEHLMRFGQDPSVVCMSRLANAQFFLGMLEQSRTTREQALERAAEVGDPFSLSVTLVFSALLAVDLDEADRCRQYVAAMNVDEHQQAFVAAREVFLGYVDVLDGRSGPGIDRIRRAIDAQQVDHAPGQRATHARLLVAAHHIADDPVGGIVAADAALAGAGTRIWEPEHRRLRAGFLASTGASPAEIEAELDRARDCAQQHGSLGLLKRIERSRSELLTHP
ncbi:MAG: AAA family ATPase [Ilumatobacteraceae bacterium]